MEPRLLIVPDVNVLISGGTISDNAPSLVVQSWKEGIIEFATSEPILDDLRRVFMYPKVVKLTGMRGDTVDKYIDTLRKGSSLVPGITSLSVSPDPDDDKLFACALEVEADYIVSMDKHHVLSIRQYEGIQTIHPTDFVRDVLQLRSAA